VINFLGCKFTLEYRILSKQMNRPQFISPCVLYGTPLTSVADRTEADFIKEAQLEQAETLAGRGKHPHGYSPAHQREQS
jgi:hypothetical protein